MISDNMSSLEAELTQKDKQILFSDVKDFLKHKRAGHYDFNLRRGPIEGALSEDHLQAVVQEYKKDSISPDKTNALWKTFIELQIRQQGLDIPIPKILCDRTPEELVELRIKGRMWVPELGLTYARLCEILPNTKNAFNSSRVLNDSYHVDYGVDVEMDINTPYADSTLKSFEKFLESQTTKTREVRGMRLKTYILASHMSKVLAGKYFDQNSTRSRLPGSSNYSEVVRARFSSGGELDIVWDKDSNQHLPSLGARSEGIKRRLVRA